MNVNPNNPIWVDFNSRDEDDAVWLNSTGTQRELKERGIDLSEGDTIWLSDGEVEMRGRVTFRVDRWVAIPDKNGFKSVSKDA